jgi:leucyl-tRNA synthetase
MGSYEPGEIEKKWQARWQTERAFAVPSISAKPKYYLLDMFPYPSGHGLHVGHLKGYVASDIVARFKRMRGYNVLHPMGWDSFGLPTERQAEKDGITPQRVTSRNIQTFKQQLNLIGVSYDWERELATSDVAYYRWTQWIFGILFERGLAYQADVAVNWCPALGTVVANEEVRDGVFIDTGDPVERRTMKQWLLKITAYADRLLGDLDSLDWPEEVKELQRNWIGRSEGALVRFAVRRSAASFEVFTTRPDTLYGCTFCVLAPEHPLARSITSPEQMPAVDVCIQNTAYLSERDRRAGTDNKTGVFTGAFAVHPLTGEDVPIWIADYVLSSYGTGAVFGCPAHDERDLEFALKFGLPIIEVIATGDTTHSARNGQGQGTMINSHFLNGLDVSAAKQRMITHLQQISAGRPEVQYNLRDWLFSRQRYWGEPIPVVHGEFGEVELDPILPVVLPDQSGLETLPPGDAPTAPLARATRWLQAISPRTGKSARREVNVMPQWAGSCWYYLRFIDPHNAKAAFDPALEKAWMPVDLYVGGIEHATLHLLYARFWHKVLYDAGYVSTSEPFKKLFNQGKVQARSFRDESGKYYYPHEVEERDGQFYSKQERVGPLATRLEKMSKSRYNVVTPDEVVDLYGADSLRLYEVFMGPLEQNNLWQTDGLIGTSRLLDRVWRLVTESIGAFAEQDGPSVSQGLHKMIQKVGADINRLSLNTAVSEMMIFVNEATKQGKVTRDTVSALIRVMAPFAPHLAEELWERLGERGFVLNATWPEYDGALAVAGLVIVAIQINGRTRAQIQLPRGATKDEALSAALRDEVVTRHTHGAVPSRVIYRENRLLNLVVGEKVRGSSSDSS